MYSGVKMRSLGNFLTILILVACFLATAGFLYLVSQDVKFSRKPAVQESQGAQPAP